MNIPVNVQESFCDEILTEFPDLWRTGFFRDRSINADNVRQKLKEALISADGSNKKDYGYDAVLWWNGELLCVAKCHVKDDTVTAIECDFSESTM